MTEKRSRNFFRRRSVSTQTPTPEEAHDAADNDVTTSLPDDDHDEHGQLRARKENTSTTLRPVFVTGSLLLLVLASLVGWLGYQDHLQRQGDYKRSLLLQEAKQGALNLTNIDFRHVDNDVQRILSSSTGKFHDEFQGRSTQFTDFIKSAKSVSQGEVAQAGLEALNGDEARVAVAMSVKTYTGNENNPQQRFWRMRITVQSIGNETVKVSNVEFVP
ncbi:hypothetical protein [Mycobacteroides abscessus]|uniref:hypothetical protein n=1 Tax=Mycobacteroides abscessus TaxID=36809 RepID=UPI00130013F0|nr:hypothetical protein [Mycobacteroides abscessus]MBE5461569.1 hypothetical protein [Mycobacteroides abscessus]QOF42350.1 hypothetical protein E3G69_001377 [Mycobacteroides abscessus]QOF47048.1 hypothetical protein E3G70_001375 [Mycobacteroides abscessus]